MTQPLPITTFEAAKAYHDAGNQAEAQKYAQKIVGEYTNSSHVTETQELLGMLAVRGLCITDVYFDFAALNMTSVWALRQAQYRRNEAWFYIGRM